MPVDGAISTTPPALRARLEERASNFFAGMVVGFLLCMLLLGLRR